MLRVHTPQALNACQEKLIFLATFVPEFFKFKNRNSNISPSEFSSFWLRNFLFLTAEELTFGRRAGYHFKTG